MPVCLPTPESQSKDITRPRVTIGVCVRNSADTIGEAIESIAQQDFPHQSMEIVFVDESDDDTPTIIQEYISKLDIVSKLFRIKDKGLGYSRNVVISNARGDYVLWIDGDMVISPDFVSKQVKFIQNHPKVGIARGSQILEPARNILATLEGYSRAAGRMADYQSEKARYKALGTGGAICRMETLSVANGFDEKMASYCEDWDLELRAREAGWELAMTDAMYHDYERHGLSWKKLWFRYWRRGYYTHYFLHKNGQLIKHYRMFPPAAFVAGLLYAKRLFKITVQKVVFVLPFEHFFKMTAWYIGYIDSHMSSYQPVT
jgi:glycosyltransferase involved in cell wall biosynthesis